MNLIERYLAEIGKRLPARNRADIQKEIRSTLEDMLEERSKAAGRPADEEMIAALLREFGRPEKVAASYAPERPLIGPQLYPFYLLVLKIVLPIVASVLFILSAVGLAIANLPPAELLAGAGKALLEIINAIVAAVGSITVVFALLDRIPGLGSEIEKDRKSEEKGWDPRTLPQVRDVEKFNIAGLAAEIIFGVAMLVVLNFYPNLIGYGFVSDGEWTFAPALSEAFFGYLPFLNILLGVEIALNLYLLGRGRWETATRWLRIAFKALWVALAVVMLTGPDLVVAPDLTPFVPLSGDEAAFLASLPRAFARGILMLVIVLNGWEALKAVYQEITGKSRS